MTLGHQLGTHRNIFALLGTANALVKVHTSVRSWNNARVNGLALGSEPCTSGLLAHLCPPHTFFHRFISTQLFALHRRALGLTPFRDTSFIADTRLLAYTLTKFELRLWTVFVVAVLEDSIRQAWLETIFLFDLTLLDTCFLACIHHLGFLARTLTDPLLLGTRRALLFTRSEKPTLNSATALFAFRKASLILGLLSAVRFTV
jgi:hypothetical protein